MYKCKRISEVGAQQLLLDFATLKESLVLMAGMKKRRSGLLGRGGERGEEERRGEREVGDEGERKLICN